jgi:hypothetical protein
MAAAFMTYRASLTTGALLVSLLTGCSRHSPAVTSPQVMDLGVVEISDGALNRHDLGGGRVLLVTPTVFTNGRVRLALAVEETDATGAIRKSEAQVQTSPDIATRFSLAEIDFSLTAHIKP